MRTRNLIAVLLALSLLSALIVLWQRNHAPHVSGKKYSEAETAPNLTSLPRQTLTENSPTPPSALDAPEHWRDKRSALLGRMLRYRQRTRA